VIVGEWQREVSGVFERVAQERGSPLYFASEEWQVTSRDRDDEFQYLEAHRRNSSESLLYALDLRGGYQARNLSGVLRAVDELGSKGFSIDGAQVQSALKQVQRTTGLMGRWQTLSAKPLMICDTGHNVDGWREVLANIAAAPHRDLHMVIGVMRDKDLDKMLPLLPSDARYYFCEVSMPRA